MLDLYEEFRLFLTNHRTGKHLEGCHNNLTATPSCYIAEIFSPTARALIGYSDVTWHLTMDLFPAKSLQTGNIAKFMTSESKRGVTVNCYARMLIEDRRCRKPKSKSELLLVCYCFFLQERKTGFKKGCQTFSIWRNTEPWASVTKYPYSHL